MNSRRPTKRLSRIFFLITGLSLFVFFQLPHEAPAAEDALEAIATLDGQPIARDRIEERAAPKLYRLRWEIYDTLKTETEKLVDELVIAREAESRNMTVEELLKTEVDEKSEAPTDEEIDAYMKEKQIVSRPGEDIRSRVTKYLTDVAVIERRVEFVKELRRKASFEFLIEPPERPRVQVSIDDDPMRGDPDAPVTIIHFASFSCENCARSAHNILRLTKEFPGTIRWVHRDFLNLFDERGLAAAEAGETAHAAGKFWEFHDRIYAASGDFDEAEIPDIIASLGIDRSLYEKAHHDATYLMEIKQDIEDGVRAGVTSVPVIFVNGRYVSGTFPYERLKEVVEEELQVAGQERGKGGELISN